MDDKPQPTWEEIESLGQQLAEVRLLNRRLQLANLELQQKLGGRPDLTAKLRYRLVDQAVAWVKKVPGVRKAKKLLAGLLGRDPEATPLYRE